MKILYVEDDAEDQEIFRNAVSKISPDTDCIFASDGQDALTILSDISSIPDYIFLDINLPRMNGFQFLKLIKNSTGLKEIPVVVFSTSNSSHDKSESLSLGAIDFVSKPNEFTQYCEVLKRFI